jgi:hypothetical protein
LLFHSSEFYTEATRFSKTSLLWPIYRETFDRLARPKPLIFSHVNDWIATLAGSTFAQAQANDREGLERG